MYFEWDPAKDERTSRERGFGFDFAALIFEGMTLEAPDAARITAKIGFGRSAWWMALFCMSSSPSATTLAASSWRVWQAKRSAACGRRKNDVGAD